MVTFALMAGLSVGSSLAASPMAAISAPFTQDVQYFMFSKFPHTKPQPLDLSTMYVKGIIDKHLYYKWMGQYGYDNDKADKIKANTDVYNSPDILLRGKWRDILSEQNYKDYMKKLGFSDTQTDIYSNVNQYYPSVQDFIQFAVRDIFVPERVDRYKLFSEFPEAILPYSRQAGITDDTLKWYWGSHWQLPAPRQVMDMVNRLQPAVLDVTLPDGSKYGEKYKPFGIDYEDIKTGYNELSDFLAVADISPYWRDRFKALTFPPITRVDLRRIYSMGLIGDAELTARLLELGYSIHDADLLSQFFKEYKNSHEKDLTRTMVLKAYNQGEITRIEVLEYIQSMGYDENEAELIVTLEDNKVRDKITKDKVYTIKNNYKHGVITIEEARSRFDALNIRATYRDKLLSELQEAKQQAAKLPDKKDIMEFMKAGLITEDGFMDYMSRIGFGIKEANLYLELVKLQMIGG